MKYRFLKWGDGGTDNPRTLSLLADTEIIAVYGKMGTVVFSGEVLNDRTGEPLPGETVTIKVTKPDSTVVELTATTNEAGYFEASYSDYPGNYTAEAIVPETDKHLAGSSGTVSFMMGKDPVRITLNVTPA